MSMPRKTPAQKLQLCGKIWSFQTPGFSVEEAQRLESNEMRTPEDAARASSLVMLLRTASPASAVDAVSGVVVEECQACWRRTVGELDQLLAARLEAVLQVTGSAAYEG